MNFINGITILLLYQLMGEILVLMLDIPVPGPVLGMFMLFLTLMIYKSTPESLESSSSTLLSHLSLLFVPAGVGLMVYFDYIADEWFSIGVALLVSTVITFAATALIMIAVSRLTVKKRFPQNG